MKTPRTLTASIAALLLTSFAAFAVTDTWDGGGADDFISTGLNWLDNSAPVSDVNNTDLIFAGTLRPFPSVGASTFSAKSVTFNNTAGAFGITGSTGSLAVGAGGITNNDVDTQTFHITVAAAATQTINAAAGALVFSGGLDISAGSNVTLGGSGAMTIAHFYGSTGTLTKSNAGALTMSSSGISILADLLLNAGTTNLVATGGNFQFIDSTGSIAVGAGATFNINDHLWLSGGAQMTKASGGTLSIAAGRLLTVFGGSDFVSGASHIITGGNVTVTEAGSTIQTTAGSISLQGGSTLAVQSGGSAVSAASLSVVGGTLTVDGTGTSASSGSVSTWGSNLGSGTVTFSNNAAGGLAGVNMATVGGATANVQILSGADITNTGVLGVGPANGGIATLLVSGAGTTWQQTVNTVTIGAATSGGGTLTVSDGAAFTALAFTINPTGTVNIDGGTLTVSSAFSGSGTVNFTAGAFALLGSTNLTVGTGGLLGQNLTLLANRQLTIGGTTTVDAFRTLTLDGGELSTGTLVNSGTIAFNSGVLAIIGAGGFDIGSGALGAHVTLGAGSTLNVTNTATVASGATLTLNGGALSVSTLNNTGTIRANLGTATTAGGTNNSGGRIFVGDTLSASGAWTNASGSQLTLQNGGLVNGAGTITNSGLVTGEGTVANPFTNASGGEVRGEFGKTLFFTGATDANASRLNLLGGTVSFAQQFTNSATGQINGQGTLYFPTTPVPSNASPTAGLMNAGNINLTSGDSQIYGTVQMQAGSRLIVSGGATASFFDVFRHSGAEVRASAGSNIVFFGEVRGAGSFTGTGTIYFEGAYSPGNSPASVTIDTGIIFGDANALTLELGGLVAGSEHDQLIVGPLGSLALDGELVLDLIDGFLPHFGDTFQMLDFDPGQLSGAFDEITIADALPGDLAFDTSSLSTAGTITVVPEPGTGALLATALALLGLRRPGRNGRRAFGAVPRLISEPES